MPFELMYQKDRHSNCKLSSRVLILMLGFSLAI